MSASREPISHDYPVDNARSLEEFTVDAVFDRHWHTLSIFGIPPRSMIWLTQKSTAFRVSHTIVTPKAETKKISDMLDSLSLFLEGQVIAIQQLAIPHSIPIKSNDRLAFIAMMLAELGSHDLECQFGIDGYLV